MSLQLGLDDDINHTKAQYQAQSSSLPQNQPISSITDNTGDAIASAIDYYLQTHDLYTTDACTLKDNRFKINNFVDPEDNNKVKNLYCWKGIIYQQPECVIGTVCDPYSYTNARTRFCLTWGCEAHKLVSNEGTEDAGLDVVNGRGGIVVYNQKDKCQGAMVNKLKCILDGMHQSVDNALDPEHKTRSVLTMVIALVVLIVGAVIFRTMIKDKTRKGILKSILPSSKI